MKKLLFAWILLILIGIFLIGWFSRGVYDSNKEDRFYNGLYLQNYESQGQVLEKAYNMESKGDWVCINVAYDMTPKEAYNTCIHECSHKAYSEIYAESCEDNPDKCMEAIK